MNDKLRKIVRDAHRAASERGRNDDYTIMQIEKAFADEGYVRTLKLNDRTVVANGKDPLGYIVYYPDKAMPGQEWLAAFKKELEEFVGGATVIRASSALIAAKRASEDPR